MGSRSLIDALPGAALVADELCPDGVRRASLRIRDDDGTTIAALLTQAEPTQSTLQVIMPGFGRTIREGSLLARALADSGYASLRFDYTNHVGASSGEVVNASVASVARDIEVVAGWLRSRGVDRVSVIAPSIGARGVLLAAGRSGLVIDSTVFVAPVVDLDASVHAATGHDHFADVRNGRLSPADVIDVTGHQIAAEFVADAVRDGYDTLASSRDHLAALAGEKAVVVLERDEWVAADDVVSLFAGSGGGGVEVEVVGLGSHDTKALPVIREIVVRTVAAVDRSEGRTGANTEELSIRRTARWVASERRSLGLLESEVSHGCR